MLVHHRTLPWVMSLVTLAMLLIAGISVPGTAAKKLAVSKDNIRQHALVRRAGHNDWIAVHHNDSAWLVHIERNVVVFDTNPCFWAATAAYSKHAHSNLTPDPRHTTGGEMIHCRKLFHLLHRMNRTITVLGDFDVLYHFTKVAVAARKPPVTIRHGPDWWGAHLGTQNQDGMNVLIPPFSEPCTMMLGYWVDDIADPRHAPVSLSDSSKIISSYYSKDKTFIGFERPARCPHKHGSRPFNRSYVFVFGKVGTSMCATEKILPIFKNSSLWEVLVAQHMVVFVRCFPELPDHLGIELNRWKAWVRNGHVTCLSALAEPVAYEDLLAYADVVMGLGCPVISPTPLQALYCQTPVIVAASQHWELTSVTGPPHAYNPRTTQDVLSAVQGVAEQCRVTFALGPGGVARKTSTCFEGHRLPVLELFEEHRALQDLRSTVERVEQECAKTVML